MFANPPDCFSKLDFSKWGWGGETEMYTTLNSNEDFIYRFTFADYVLCGNGGGLSAVLKE